MRGGLDQSKARASDSQKNHVHGRLEWNACEIDILEGEVAGAHTVVPCALSTSLIAFDSP